MSAKKCPEVVNMFDHIEPDDKVRLYMVVPAPCDQFGRITADDHVRSGSECFAHLFYCLYGVGVPVDVNDLVDSEHFHQDAEKTTAPSIIYHDKFFLFQWRDRVHNDSNKGVYVYVVVIS